MPAKCYCGLNMSDLARASEPRDQGFRKVIRAVYGKEFYTDIKDKTRCFECEERK
jgi:hypothetical protein